MPVAVLRIRPPKEKEDYGNEIISTQTLPDRASAIRSLIEEFEKVGAEHCVGHIEIHEVK